MSLISGEIIVIGILLSSRYVNQFQVYNKGMKRDSPVWYFATGQILFYVGLTCSVLLLPRGALMDDGISYYGIHWLTALPYLIALIGGGVVGGIVAGRYLPRDAELDRIKVGLYLFGILAIGVALTPYSVSNFVDNLHTAFGSLLFALQLVLTGWLAFAFLRDWRLMTLWGLEFAAGVLSAYYIVMPSGYLFVSQVVFQLSFGASMLVVLGRISASEVQVSARHPRSSRSIDDRSLQ